MMTQQKTFDCVEMKNRAQEQLASEIAGMSREQELEYLNRPPTSPSLRSWLERVKANANGPTAALNVKAPGGLSGEQRPAES